jgi:hypothetical protein
MTFNPEDEYGEEKVVLTLTGEYQGYAVEAYCSPDAKGDTYIGGGDTRINEFPATKERGAPFRVDVVIGDNVHPQDGEVRQIREELGTEFKAQFDGKINEVYTEIIDADNPLESIMEMSDGVEKDVDFSE